MIIYSLPKAEYTENPISYQITYPNVTMKTNKTNMICKYMSSIKWLEYQPFATEELPSFSLLSEALSPS